METHHAKRKLTAILSADVKDYSRLMGEDEEATVHTLTAYRDMIATLIDLHRGRLVDSPGDNLLAEFASVVDAVQCAVEVQRELKARNQELPESRRMEFRIGVNLGDVIEEGERIYGDGVNVAARLEALAEGGGISISRTVFDQVKNKLALGFEYLGEHTVKNIKEPVRLYRVEMDREADGTVAGDKRARQRRWHRAVIAAVVVLLLGASGIAAWKFYVGQSVPPAEVPSEETIFPPLPEKASVAAQAVHSLASSPEPESEPREFESTLHGRPDGHAPEGYAEGHALGDREKRPLDVALKDSSPFEPEEKGKGPVMAVWEKRRREVQDRICGVPQNILKLQSLKEVKPPSIDAAVAIALKAAREAARPLIDTRFHKGRRLTVPDDFRTIQSAIDAAKRGDIVVVKPGTYFELIVMKDGVKLVSDSAEGGDQPVAVEGARMKLPRRTLRTIIDGSKAKTSHSGMIDFNPGVGRNTIVDGFTIQNLPKQDHHIPGHPHGLNVRGASPVIVNCYLRNNGSTGIGNHVVYADQQSPMPKRDFRWANVKHRAEAVIYHNIIRNSLGLGIGCNHFSAPHILGNEVLLNSDAELGEAPSPGMGAKHGAAPTIIGNIVHDNPGGGILSKAGALQGAYGIDRPTHPTVMKNVVYRNGKLRPAIGDGGGGSTQAPVRFLGNFIYDSGSVGIGLRNGAVGIIEENIVSGSASPGIAINGATALRLNRNKVTGANAPGISIVAGSKVLEMVGNAADSNQGPRFVLRGGTIANPEI
jgi:class 3 adenylate cyclase